jgi:hypothetical protein
MRMALLSTGFIEITIPLVGAVLAWYANERRKRAWEEYVRKEENYKKLLSLLRGFHVSTQNTATKQGFLDELNQCWLYCPDDIIRKAYAFLDTVKVGSQSDDIAREAACGELIAAIRRDMLNRRLVKKTQLTAKDFRHLQAT